MLRSFTTCFATLSLAAFLLCAAAFAQEPALTTEEHERPWSQTSSLINQFWELDEKDKRGLYILRTFKPNYILPYHYSDNINTQPSTPTRGPTEEETNYTNEELKIQLSFRTKVFEDILLPNADLWVSYTQTSLWQAWNKDLSRPFRSTDHNPDIFYVVPVSPKLDIIPGPVQLEMVKIGLAHHSNGQSKPQSRSWNYWHMGGAMTVGPWLLETSYKHRVKESLEEDDNPDLISYKGNLETRVTGLFGPTTVSLERNSQYLSLNDGSWQLDIMHPLNPNKPLGLRIHLQLFSGYGETLLDYNHRQNRIGLGFVLLNI